MGHSTVWACDWQTESTYDVFDYALKHESERFEQLIAPVNKENEAMNDLMKSTAMIEYFLHMNKADKIKILHQVHQNLIKIGTDEYPIGALWLANYWHFRNLMIYKNLITLIENDDDRLFVLYGASHIYSIKQLLEDSGLVTVELADDYLLAKS